MTLPTYAAIELSIRAAWGGDMPLARARLLCDEEPVELVAALGLLASAPFEYKNAQAAAVRAAWVRAGGVTPVVPRPGIAQIDTRRPPAL